MGDLKVRDSVGTGGVASQETAAARDGKPAPHDDATDCAESQKSDCLFLVQQWQNPHAQWYSREMLEHEHQHLRLAHLGFDRERLEKARCEPAPAKSPSELFAEPILLHINEVVEGKHGGDGISDEVNALADANYPHYELHLVKKYGAPLAVVGAILLAAGYDGVRIGFPGREGNIVCVGEEELDVIRGGFETSPEAEFGRLWWKYYAPVYKEGRYDFV